jgi:hypothetical protein
LAARHRLTGIRCNPAGPAGALVAECERRHIELAPVAVRELAQACGAAYDAVMEHRWRHIDQPELNAAAVAATKRPIGDAWIFDRRLAVDISPLVACTIAAHGGVEATEPNVRWLGEENR